MRFFGVTLLSLLVILGAGPLIGPAKAQQAAPGGFDYYVLALSWTPDWCARTGDSQGAAECARHGLTFTLHGLWPQYEAGGYPSDCRTVAADPARSDTAAMADIMGSAGLAWHEWKTHGRCTGLPWDAYFALMRKARGAVTVPPLFARVDHTLRVGPDVIRAAFVEANPGLAAEDIAVTCDRQIIDEVRICLTRDLSPRPCGAAIQRCTLPAADLDAVR